MKIEFITLLNLNSIMKKVVKIEYSDDYMECYPCVHLWAKLIYSDGTEKDLGSTNGMEIADLLVKYNLPIDENFEIYLEDSKINRSIRGKKTSYAIEQIDKEIKELQNKKEKLLSK